MLDDQALLRYSRQILLSEVDVEGQDKLKNSRVVIIGMGGLGSPASLYLAAAGVGTLCLADFDTIDLSNLQRQIMYGADQIKQQKAQAAKQRLSNLNPDITIHPFTEVISEENIYSLIENADVVLDCTDNFLTRDLINQACFHHKKRLVSGAAIRLQGQITTFDFTKKQSPCYHCLYGDGNEQELTCSEAGVLGPVVGVVGTLQALEVIKLLVGFGEPLVGRLLAFNAINSQFRELKITKDPACTVCGGSYE